MPKLTLEEKQILSAAATINAKRTWAKLKKANKNAGMERSRKMTAARYGVKLDEKAKK